MVHTKKGRKVALVAGLALVVLSVATVWTYWKEIRFLLRFERLAKNAQGYPEYRHRQAGIVFVRLPGGKFDMGSPPAEQGRLSNEGPVHSVTLSPFLLAKYEVSQAEWKRVMGNNPSRFRGANLPVEMVSWEDCQRFCRKTGTSLPTAAQWEYACRAGTTTPFVFGETLTKKQANFSGEKTVEVDSFEPNGYGLYNLEGNVWEWCEDIWDPGFYKRPEASRTNPVCTSGSEVRVFRGGSWNAGVRYCRSAHRSGFLPPTRKGSLGLRPAWSSP